MSELGRDGLVKVEEVEILSTDRGISCEQAEPLFLLLWERRIKEGCSSEEFGGACRKRKTYLLITSVSLVVCLMKVRRGDGMGFRECPEGSAWPL